MTDVCRGSTGTDEPRHDSTSDRRDGDPPTVTVGLLSDEFDIANDGPGLDIDPGQAIACSVSTRDDGTGFGLAIVTEIAAAHGWEMRIVNDDGTRVEFRGTD